MPGVERQGGAVESRLVALEERLVEAPEPSWPGDGVRGPGALGRPPTADPAVLARILEYWRSPTPVEFFLRVLGRLVQQSCIYAVEDMIQADWLDDDYELDRTMVERFATDCLEKAGWSVGAPLPIHFAEHDARAGWVNADGIHLDPRSLSRWTVCHELAHYVDPRDGHGPRFCASLLELVRAGFGEDVAMALFGELIDVGVVIDYEWVSDTWLASVDVDDLAAV